MFSVIICDDDPVIVKSLISDIHNILDSEHINHECIPYYSLDELYSDLKNSGINGFCYDLMILDIEFLSEQSDGIVMGKYIRETLQDELSFIMYISSKEQYAMDLFQIRPFDFLTKPIDIIRLKNDLLKILFLSNIQSESITIKSRKNNITLPLSSILYFQAFNHTIQVVCSNNNKYEYPGRLRDLKDNLVDKNFFCPHNSYLVNYSSVIIWTRNELTLSNNDTIPVSRSHHQEVMDIQFKNEVRL